MRNIRDLHLDTVSTTSCSNNMGAMLGQGQYHLAVAGGYAVGCNPKRCAGTHPLPRGGTDCVQA